MTAEGYGRPGTTAELLANRFVQIGLVGILILNERDLPSASPFLDFFFAFNRNANIVVTLEPDKAVDA